MKTALVAVMTLAPTLAMAQGSGTWFKAGSHPMDFDMGTDPKVTFKGKGSGFIRANNANPTGFGTYMQMFEAGDHRGKRVRFDCYVKSENVSNWAGLWMRVDKDKKATAFDNMQNRAIPGTSGWTHHEVVLDVIPKRLPSLLACS